MPHELRTFPAEWCEQEAVLMAWPHAATDWVDVLDEAQSCFMRIAKAISPDEKVVVVAPQTHEVSEQLEGIDGQHNVVLLEVPTNDTWARDFGPITLLRQKGRRLFLDFKFNGWGLKFPSNLDNQICRNMARAEVLDGIWECAQDFVLEGGAVDCDGNGTILTTTACLLSPNRNPHLTKQQIEHELMERLGVKRVVWLEHGYLAGDDTDCHIDTLARFAPNNTILYTATDDEGDEHFTELHAMEQELKALTTLDGKPYRLLPLFIPPPIFDNKHQRLPATYANFLITNNHVLVPTYGSPQHDNTALSTVAAAFPGRRVEGIDCRVLIEQHGSLHCVTMQIPKMVK